MEKDQQGDSLPNIPMKVDYAPSEVYSSSEPPPAYQRPRTTAVQVAKIVSITTVLVALIIGGSLIAVVYISEMVSCRHLNNELNELRNNLPRLQPEALIQEEPSRRTDAAKSEDSKNKMNDIYDYNSPEEAENGNGNSDTSSNEDESEEAEKITPIHIKLPLHLDIDDLAGAMFDKNQRSKMNCVVEKKRAEEVVDHKPKTVNLPFGVNITTDPRMERITGERMVIICESGSLHRNMHQNPQPQQHDEQEDTVMIHPIVIPLGPINPYQTHMPQQMRPMMPQQMRPIMPQQIPQEIRAIMPQEMRPQIQQEMRPPMPNPMENLRPPMHPMMSQHIPQPQSDTRTGPNPFIQNIIQQLIAQRLRVDMQRAQEESSQQRDSEEVPSSRQIPIPVEILRQINRLPTNEVVISVSEQETEEPPQELRIVQHPRQSAQEMNGRQTYARGLPVHIPVPMMQQQAEPQEQEPQQSASAVSEELRPHYVQPRSVRSVEAAFARDKRVKRSCDCVC